MVRRCALLRDRRCVDDRKQAVAHPLPPTIPSPRRRTNKALVLRNRAFRSFVLVLATLLATRTPSPARATGEVVDDGNDDVHEDLLRSVESSPPQTMSNTTKKTRVFPFFLTCDDAESSSSLSVLRWAVESYRREVDRFVSALQEEEVVVRVTEDALRCDSSTSSYAARLRSEIEAAARLTEADGRLMERLLRPFDVVSALPCSSSIEETEEPSQRRRVSKNESNDERRFVRVHESSRQRSDATSSSAYESAAQIAAHLVRDWTDEGRGIRQSVYGWCVREIERLLLVDELDLAFDDEAKKRVVRVLVPGAGLGRLARDVASIDASSVSSSSSVIVRAEANDVSLVMAAAAHRLLHGREHGTVFHPYVLDDRLNEVDAARRRYRQSTIIVDDGDGDVPSDNTLSYTVGDFVSTYADPRRRATFDVVVTCFFLDTATNVLEHAAVVRHALRDGGAWINVGPLQWHRNARLRPTAEDLRATLVDDLGFSVESWFVDDVPVHYRGDDDGDHRTRTEAYAPLRFVLRRPRRRDDDGVRADVANAIRDARSSSRATPTTTPTPNEVVHLNGDVDIERMLEEVD